MTIAHYHDEEPCPNTRWSNPCSMSSGFCLDAAARSGTIDQSKAKKERSTYVQRPNGLEIRVPPFSDGVLADGAESAER